MGDLVEVRNGLEPLVAQMGPRPGVDEAVGVGAAALHAGPVPGSEGCRFIEEEELGVAVFSHYFAMTALEFEHATDPPAVRPWPAHQLLLSVHAAAAVPEHRPARTVRVNFAEGINAVSQGHGRRSVPRIRLRGRHSR